MITREGDRADDQVQQRVAEDPPRAGRAPRAEEDGEHPFNLRRAPGSRPSGTPGVSGVGFSPPRIRASEVYPTPSGSLFAVERLGAERELRVDRRVRVQVGELAWRGRRRRSTPGSGASCSVLSTPSALPVAVEERAARVTGDAGRDGGDVVAPAVARVAEADAGLRAERVMPWRSDELPYEYTRLAGRGAGRRQRGRATPVRDRRVHLRRVGRRRACTSAKSLNAHVSGFVSPARLHGEPRVVDERAGLRRAADRDRRAERQRAGGAAVGLGAAAGARAVRGLADVDVGRRR